MQAQLIAGAVIVALAFAGGWQVNGWRLKASEARAEAAAEKAAIAATDAAVTAIKGLEKVYVPIKAKAEVITREVPVYRDCVHTDDGLRVLNEALTPDRSSLPGSDATH